MERLILIKYGEIHLKGLNRPFFKRLLIKNLADSLRGYCCSVYEQQGRVYVSGFGETDEDEVVLRCKNTFGVVGVCPALKAEKALDSIEEAAIAQIRAAMARQRKSVATFKVHSRREDKSFYLNSEAIQREIGARMLCAMDCLRVDVHNPDVMIEIEVREKAYVYANVIPAVGGIPVGSSGQAMLMLSGGIDSPVAGYMMAKRGMIVSAVHFQSPPHTGEAARQKVIDLIKQLTRYLGPVTLYIVTFTRMQEALYLGCHPGLLTILMRRAMLKISQSLAHANGDRALVTGESLGQVASQTLESICATDDVAMMPVFRPLIGMDKTEIIERAREIGTFEISIRPGEDCCTVFVPKHPVTKPELRRLRLEEEKIPFDDLIAECIESAQHIRIDSR
jgi:thiamine biosynthesis protein ThiI